MPTKKTDKGQLAIDGGSPVRTKPLPWELPGTHWVGKEELELLTQVANSRSPFRYYGLEPQHMVDRLEAAFRKRLDRAHALGVASGTAALQVAMGALGVGPGDEVLVPGYLWVSCLGAVIRSGAIPRLVDIDETFNMSPADLEAKIGPHAKAVLVVHMSGAPADMPAIMKIARKHGLKVVEDCAQANGASLHGKLAGTFADLAVFSFQANKNMTSGEGGMVVCDDRRLYDRAFALHDLGYARNEQGRLVLDNDQMQLWGIGARMSELTGAMALAQLGKLDKITAAMRRAKWIIREELDGLKGLEFRKVLDPEGDSGPFLITLYPTPELAQRFTAALAAEGIRGAEGSLACIQMEQWGLHWHFNNRSLVNRRSNSPDGFPWTHPANAFAKDYRYDRGVLPRCDDYARRAGLLTIASCLTDRDIRDIVAAFRKVAARVL